MSDKYIFHIDVNSAFLSWTAAYRVRVLGEEEDLRLLPSVIGGDQASRHGIVLAKSILAGKCGIHTGEPLVSAREKCPGLLVVPPDYHLYVSSSKALIQLLKKYSDCVVQYSIDEAWAEFEGYEKLYGSPVAFANDLKNEIKEKLGFTVNIGISNNRLLAKMAGELEKPDKVHTLFPWEIPEKLWPQPVGNLFFVGKSARKKLASLGIRTIGELANTDLTYIRAHMKRPGEIIWNYANGRELCDYMFSHEENKGYGNSLTAPRDVEQLSFARQLLLSLCETVGMRLRADQVRITGISVSITTAEFQRMNRQMKLRNPTNITEELYSAACRLYEELWDGKTPVRQIGVHTTGVTHEGIRQYDLFDNGDYEKYEKWNQAIDEIRGKYGEDAVMRASFLHSGLSHTAGGLSRERRTGVTAGISMEKEKRFRTD